MSTISKMEAALSSPVQSVSSIALGNRTLRRFNPGLIPLIIIPLCLTFGLFEPKFLRIENLLNILRNASYLSLVATGQMLVLIVGGFDLSIGAVIALTSVFTTLTMVGMTTLMPDATVVAILLSSLLGILPALAIGAMNGICVSLLRVPPFMVTIGTMSIAGGLAAYISGGTSLYGLPDMFTDTLGRGRVFGIPIVIPIAIILIAVMTYGLTMTRSGRYVYAVGGNERAARVSGINARFYIGMAYVLSSALAALVGLLLTARLGSGEATLGSNLTLESIAAAIVGGVSLKGGAGRLPQVVCSAIFLSIIANGMNLVRIDSRYQVIVIGLIVILAVALQGIRTKRTGKL